jgi:hypothetical protein
LRGAEAIVEPLRAVVAVCQRQAAKYNDAIGRYEDRILAVEDEIAEARQDVAVVRALLAEEQQRVVLINARRARVIREQIPFVAFRRPPVVNTLRPVPVRVVDPLVVSPSVPACLSRDLDPPQELQKMIDLFRESPVRWFPRIEALLERIDRRHHFDRLLSIGQGRFFARSAMLYREIEFLQVTKGRFQSALSNVLSAQRNRTLARRQAIGTVEIGQMAILPWSEVHRIAKQTVSIGDLIEGTRADLSKAAASELETIGNVSACLTAKFAEVLPEIRLDWTLRFSQFDESVTIRSLSMLPRWGEIDFLDRHDLQSYVDWLYAQVDGEEPEAVEAIANLVRAAVLLSSHAPVNRLLQGKIDEPRDVEEGQPATVRFDASQIPHLRRGLNLHVIQQDLVVAHAVIDDLLEDRAQIRIVKNLTENRTIKLGDDTTVRNAPQTSRALKQLEQGGAPSRTKALIDAMTVNVPRGLPGALFGGGGV